MRYIYKAALLKISHPNLQSPPKYSRAFQPRKTQPKPSQPKESIVGDVIYW